MNDMHTLQYMAMKEANIDIGIVLFVQRLCLVSMGQVMVDQLIVGTTGRTALGISLVEPEPHNSSVVFLTKTAHQPLGSNAWHDVRILPCASILLGLQHTPGILSQFEGLQGASL